MAATDEEILAPADIRIVKWRVKKRTMIFKGSVLALYVDTGTDNNNQPKKLKSSTAGIVSKILVSETSEVRKNDVLLTIQPHVEVTCTHPTIMKDMCADCGADLRSENGLAGDRKKSVAASVAMVHSIPELIVSQEQALEIGKEDENRLLKQRKLVLLVDLDQTLIHTTNDNIPPNLKDVKHFQLFHGKDFMWYHTRFRPYTQMFLESASKKYELHICTFGVRLYAHTIARLLDPEEKFFSHRILSRDECFDALSKTANLKALFPCGDKMVSIIDDREDVWNFAPNLIHVKPYRFFQGTADINAPPGLSKSEHDGEPLVHKVVDHTEGNNKTGSDVTATDGGDHHAPGEAEHSKKSSSGDVEPCEKSTPEELLPGENISPGRGDNKMDDETSLHSVEAVISQNSSATICSSEPERLDNILAKSESTAPDPTVGNSGDVSEIGISRDKTMNLSSEGDNVNGKNDKVTLLKPEGRGDLTPQDDLVADSSLQKEEEIEWDDEDDYLLYLEEILSRIHKAYYDMYEQSLSNGSSELPDLKNIIPYVRKKVLKGTNLVFSGMFPLNMPVEQSRAYTVAKALGASVQNDIVPRKPGTDNLDATTHLVAAKPGTGKHKQALKTKGVHIVSGDWLWCCNERWARVDERLFPLAMKEGKNTPSPEGSDSPKKNSKKRKNPAGVDWKDSDSASDDISDSGSIKKARTGDVENPMEVCMEPCSSSPSDVILEPETSFAASYNPLYSLSDEDIECMDKEVNEILDEDDGSSEESDSEREARLREKVLGKTQETDSDSDSLSGDLPRGWKLHRKSCSPKNNHEEEDAQKRSDAENDEETENELERYQKNIEAFVDDDSSESSGSEVTIGSVDDEIADAVEKEFLGT